MKIHLSKGFTLIELLVVITIIGILATGAVSTFTSQIQKARDSTRISDLQALQSAVEQRFQDVGSYPLSAAIATFRADIADYLPTVPQDAKNAQDCQGGGAVLTKCGYVYRVGDSNGSAPGGIANSVYEFSAGFENKGNVANKATTDNGDDAVRYEISNNPSVAPATTWATGATPVAGSINITK